MRTSNYVNRFRKYYEPHQLTASYPREYGSVETNQKIIDAAKHEPIAFSIDEHNWELTFQLRGLDEAWEVAKRIPVGCDFKIQSNPATIGRSSDGFGFAMFCWGLIAGLGLARLIEWVVR